MKTNNNYNELVDHLVSTMPSNSMTIHSTKDSKSFDELYEEYSSMSTSEQLNNIKELGRDLFNKLDSIIDTLDTILQEDSSK